MTHNKIMGQKVLRKHREEERRTKPQHKKPPNKPTKINFYPNDHAYLS